MPANGTTVAVQTVWVNQGTPTETLTFTHHDASATGAQETDASGNLLQTSPRTAEYDRSGVTSPILAHIPL